MDVKFGNTNIDF